MLQQVKREVRKKHRRIYGEHLTPVQIFERYVFPEIKCCLREYIWVDLFAGEGNLILPILDFIPKRERIEFFEKHIYLFDIQQEMVQRARRNAIKRGIPPELAKEHILRRDTLKEYPEFLLELDYPVYHITNPPYLYIGYIAKHAKKYLEYFKGANRGYQDLYQLAMINDLRRGIQRMIYIIPSNFLFGFSVSNRIRDDFLSHYWIRKAIIFETRIFSSTGTNVSIFFFERKKNPGPDTQRFPGIKINSSERTREYILVPENHYRAGNEFEEFVEKYRASKPLKVRFYLTMEEVKRNRGEHVVRVLDANGFDGREYSRMEIHVNDALYSRIKSNILFVRTVDTGRTDGRAGLRQIHKEYGVDAILVTKARYRTHPIHVFLEPTLSREEQILLMKYFNILLEYFREITDSEFMTTYKYSPSTYTRKYLGLSQVRKLIETFPWLGLSESERKKFRNFIDSGSPEKLLTFIKSRIFSIIVFDTGRIG